MSVLEWAKLLSLSVALSALLTAAMGMLVWVVVHRGWGRAPQPRAGEDGGDIRVTIRQIVEGGDED